MTARPVTTWENEAAKGQALSAEKIYRSNLAQVAQLRARQAEYIGSLPTDPRDCIRAAIDAINPNADYLPHGLEDALHLSFTLEPCIRQLSYDGVSGAERDALAYVAERIRSNLETVVEQIEHVAMILRNAKSGT